MVEAITQKANTTHKYISSLKTKPSGKITNYHRHRFLHKRLRLSNGELWINWRNSTDGDLTSFRFTGMERDLETGLYYFGARYLDPRTSRWLSVDPAMYQGDYFPVAPINDEARRHNQNLPGEGGVFNYVNLHVYHYAGNNPIRYVDPDGRELDIVFTIRSYVETREGLTAYGELTITDKDTGANEWNSIQAMLANTREGTSTIQRYRGIWYQQIKKYGNLSVILGSGLQRHPRHQSALRLRHTRPAL